MGEKGVHSGNMDRAEEVKAESGGCTGRERRKPFIYADKREEQPYPQWPEGGSITDEIVRSP